MIASQKEMNGAMKPQYTRDIVIAALLCAAMSSKSYSQRDRQSLPLPLAPPRPYTNVNRHADRREGRLITLHPTNSVLLVQVISVVTEPGGRMNLIGIPMIHSATFRILETLSGPSKFGDVEVVNPEPNPQSEFGGHADLPDRDMRVGELWIVPYSNQGKAYNLRDKEYLSGLDDPILQQYRQHIAWTHRADSENVMREMVGMINSSQASQGDRIAALMSFEKYTFTSGATAEEAAKRSDTYKRELMSQFANNNTPRNLKQKAIQLTRIDLTAELARDSIDNLQLNVLLSIVKYSGDDQLVAAASVALFDAVRTQPKGKFNTTVYFCPEIIDALEARAASDKVDNKLSRASGVLSNLDLAQRRTIGDIKNFPNVDLQIRHVQLIPDAEISPRIVAPTYYRADAAQKGTDD